MSIYKSHTHGAIPLSAIGKRLMHSLIPERKQWMKPCRCAASWFPHRLSWCSKL